MTAYLPLNIFAIMIILAEKSVQILSDPILFQGDICLIRSFRGSKVFLLYPLLFKD